MNWKISELWWIITGLSNSRGNFLWISISAWINPGTEARFTATGGSIARDIGGTRGDAACSRVFQAQATCVCNRGCVCLFKV